MASSQEALMEVSLEVRIFLCWLVLSAKIELRPPAGGG